MNGCFFGKSIFFGESRFFGKSRFFGAPIISVEFSKKILNSGKSKTPPNSLVKMLKKNYGAKFAPNEPMVAQLSSKRTIRDYEGL